ncbi:hypothetical protein [Kineococcus terrestris]|uniref:hypothetical protein n=1 Tax=Kineococcus terrestris TaxID=2044856 RepID=UPI0034DAD37A
MSLELFPYLELQGTVTLRVTRVELDGKEMPWTTIFHDSRAVELRTQDGSRWSTARLAVELDGPAAEFEQRKTDLQDVRALVVLNCGPSNTRVSVPLHRTGEGARWQGELEIDRSDWYGDASLRGTIVAGIEGVANRQAGFALPWSVSFDDRPPREPQNSVRTTWIDFVNPPEEVHYLKAFEDEVCFLRLDAEEPHLYLNEGFSTLKALLTEKARRPLAERVLRDQVLSDVASHVWPALFIAALEAVLDEEGDLRRPDEQWQRNALDALLPRLYPEMSLDEALREAFEARREPSSAARLQERLLPAVRQHVGYGKTLRKSLDAIGRSGTEDEE